MFNNNNNKEIINFKVLYYNTITKSKIPYGYGKFVECNTNNEEEDMGIESEECVIVTFRRLTKQRLIPTKIKHIISNCSDIEWTYDQNRTKSGNKSKSVNIS